MECKAFNAVNSCESAVTLFDLPRYLQSVIRSVSIMWADYEIQSPDSFDVLCTKRGISIVWAGPDEPVMEICANIQPMYFSQENVATLHAFAMDRMNAIGMKPSKA